MAEIQAHLTLIGDSFDIEAVTQRLGYTPQWIKRKDDILRNGRLFGHCEWGIETRWEISDDISATIEDITTVMPCPRELLRQVALTCNATWHILFTMYVTEDFPVVVFPPSFSAFAAEIDASVGFDVYLLNSQGDNLNN